MHPPLSVPPSRECDLVMKGGITSGVVYPGAVVKLAEKFRFVNIGGTSAGAIAAAATAAAELGRGKAGAGFGELAKLPRQMGEDVGGNQTRLLALFQPQTGTRTLHRVFLALAQGSWVRAVAWIFASQWLRAVLWAAPGLALGILVPSLRMVVGAVVALMVLIGVGLGFWKNANRALKENGFGLCSGRGTDARCPALTDWLENLLETLAGRALPDGALPAHPLTFGDLKANPAGPINLEMMSSCLTMGRPYRLPFRDNEQCRENEFYFYEGEFSRYFSPRLVGWLKQNQRSATKPAERDTFNRQGLYALPDTDDLPVVVAVRMSLSFPFLLSAVPLHVRKRPLGLEIKGELELGRCWFSDGGICSNFPVHFFESPLPRRPTFALNLLYVGAASEAGFYLPTTNDSDQQPPWIDLEKPQGNPVVDFALSILDTARCWPDALQMRMPGYRDRIGHVQLTEGEGGLNLDMPLPRITELSNRGSRAAAELMRRFGSPEPKDVVLTWTNHRQIRLRSFLDATEEMLVSLEAACAHPQAGDEDYAAFIANETVAKIAGYDWASGAQRARAAQMLQELRRLVQLVDGRKPAGLRAQAPHPRAEFRLRPRI